MNNREEWSDTERSVQVMIDRIREEYPDFWKESPLGNPEPPKEEPRDLRSHYHEQKKRKRNRRTAIAACFVGLFTVSSGMALWLNSSAAYGVKFALEKRFFEAKGLITTSPDSVNEQNEFTVVVKEEKDIEKYKQVWDGIMLPCYIPDGYVFKELYIQRFANSVATAQYIYLSGEKELTILLSSPRVENSEVLWLTSETVRKGENLYYIWEDNISNTAGINVLFKDKSLVVCGSVNQSDLIEIVNKMQ